MKIKKLAKQNLLQKEVYLIEDFLPFVLTRGSLYGLNRNKLERIIWTVALLDLNKRFIFDIDKDIKNEVNILHYKDDCSRMYHCVKLGHETNLYVKLIFEEKLKWKNRRNNNG